MSLHFYSAWKVSLYRSNELNQYQATKIKQIQNYLAFKTDSCLLLLLLSQRFKVSTWVEGEVVLKIRAWVIQVLLNICFEKLSFSFTCLLILFAMFGYGLWELDLRLAGNSEGERQTEAWRHLYLRNVSRSTTAAFVTPYYPHSSTVLFFVAVCCFMYLYLWCSSIYLCLHFNFQNSPTSNNTLPSFRVGEYYNIITIIFNQKYFLSNLCWC